VPVEFSTDVILLLLLVVVAVVVVFRKTSWFRELRRRTNKYVCSTPNTEVIWRSDVVAINNEKWGITEVLPT
jgi:hypothetical protein